MEIRTIDAFLARLLSEQLLMELMGAFLASSFTVCCYSSAKLMDDFEDPLFHWKFKNKGPDCSELKADCVKRAHAAFITMCITESQLVHLLLNNKDL